MALPMTKSTLALARQAMLAGREALPKYGKKHAPKIYTQHQLFAVLAIKTFFGLDYRGLVALLAEWSDLRKVLGLKKVPHFTAVQKFHARLTALKKGASSECSPRS